MNTWSCGCRAARTAWTPISARRWLSTSALERCLLEPVQSYMSTSRDPYVNLSIEHYMLQKSSPESAILFVYVNRPSIIIGRNQNPWLEVNIALLKESQERPETEPPGLGVVDLVRRRSGGGTVFHDEGNVNWTVICPSATFTRDKHAEMVVRALRSCGIERARVNERHDIVLDQGEHVEHSDPDDTHATPYTNKTEGGPRPLKVSGSAYKLTRGRALHHGTCLLSSPNLNIIPHYLHSPAKPFIKARGVESVSSPVGNILLSNEDFSGAVRAEFTKLYGLTKHGDLNEIGDGLLNIDAVRKGFNELKSLDWTFLQTPQFNLSNVADDSVNVNIELTVRHGLITDGAVSIRHSADHAETRLEIVHLVEDQKLHELRSWDTVLSPGLDLLESRDRLSLTDWLQRMLPAVDD